MMKLTRYTNFNDLKSATKSVPSLSKSEKERLRQYETFLSRLSERLSQQKNAKSNKFSNGR